MLDYSQNKFKECPYCGRRIGFGSIAHIDGIERGENGYFCENFLVNKKGEVIADIAGDYNLVNTDTVPKCNTYVRAHKFTTLHSKKDDPIGTLANQELRNVREEVKKLFTPFWSKGKINEVWRDYICSYIDKDHNEVYCQRISPPDTDDVILKIIFTGECVTVNKEMVGSVKTRTKAHIWLTMQLGLSMDEARISNMDIETSLRAIDELRKVV